MSKTRIVLSQHGYHRLRSIFKSYNLKSKPGKTFLTGGTEEEGKKVAKSAKQKRFIQLKASHKSIDRW